VWGVEAMGAAENAPSDQGKNSAGPFLADYDKSDVLFFINSLIEQNSALMGKVAQIEHLMNLAQEAVLEASQRVEAAKEESKRIIAEASEKAGHQSATMIRQAREEAEAVLRSARAEAERIKRSAEEEAARLLADVKVRATREAMPLRQGAGFVLPQARAAPREGSKFAGKPVATQQQALYSGVADVEISPPVPVAPLNEVIKLLKRTPNIKVISLEGTVNRGLSLKLSLERPAPLIKILASLPPVEKVSPRPGRSRDTDIVSETNNHCVISLKM
jgi:vacuolar-type H+-ATPase subunit H